MQSHDNQVKRRRVFYIPGYDPFPPRRYRELYRKEGAKQAEISGYEIKLRSSRQSEGYGWHVFAKMEGGQAEADIEVLTWSDLVQGSMQSSIPATFAMLVQTAWIYIHSGALRRLMWLRKGPVIAALYPIAMLLAQLLVAVVVSWMAGALVSSYIHPWLGWLVALPLIILILRGFRRLDRHLYAYYLMHDYAYSAQLKGANPPELESRMKEFAERIAVALVSDVDEVLVVGHSSGAHLAVSILADLIRAGRAPQGRAQLAFLSVGQVVPMVSFLPKASRLRRDLRDLSRSQALTWVDISAPGDGCAFALCDPVAVSGVAPPDKRWPLVVSAAFSQTLSPQLWRRLRWRFFRLHFQYLCAFDRPGDYDYFKITAGPQTLAQRYRGRQPSKSRIDVAASPCTTIEE